MTRKRTIATMAALGGFTAAVALLSGLPTAKADELTDLRANQELLQHRVDQLAQIPGVYPSGPPAATAGAGIVGGSFPRSFLIPGTDTSIRVGGQIQVNTDYWIVGGNPHSTPQSPNAGSTGQLGAIPLSRSGAPASTGHSIFLITPVFSKLNVETRTPSAWGEARTFIEFDFSGTVAESRRPTAISDNLIPRLRYAYGTLGGFLAGQANSNFSDSDSGMEVISTSGLTGNAGVSRIPQLRYTMPLAGWGLPGALSVSAETPESEFWSPLTGTAGSDANPAIAGNPTKSKAPDLTAAWYIPQPWGHVDFSAVLRPALQIKDGLFVDRTYTGYGFNFSGDVKPRWFGWDRDYIVWTFTAGDAIGRYIGAQSTNDTIGLVSNYSAALSATAAGAALITVKPVRAFGGTVGYQHRWNPNWRSNIGVGIYHEDINLLRGAVCTQSQSAAAKATRNAGTAGCSLNKELINPTVNVFWNPVPFVDVALEYMYGHRMTVGNARGDEHVLEGLFRVKF